MLVGSRLILGFLLLAVGPGLAAQNVGAATATETAPAAGKVTVTGVKGLIDGKETVYVFDANERESYLAGHIPGAQWIEFDAVTAAKLPKSKDARIVFYCYNPLCGASPMAAKQALALGYRNVWVMSDGITGWRAAKMPVVSGPSAK
jgi:rhodanese-related sulfurtransferase